MKTLTLEDYEKASADNNVSVAKLKAIAKVESAGNGFQTDGKPKILFEGHKFRKYTGKKYDQSHPDLSYPYSDPKRRQYYKGDQHARLRRAAWLDHDAAHMACSWGKFQVMGFNWKMCGFSSLKEFIDAMYESEAGHLRAFIGFLNASNLLPALREGNWARVAEGYNGSAYRENHYDTKMRDYFNQYKDQGLDYIGQKQTIQIIHETKPHNKLMDNTLEKALKAKPARWWSRWFK